MPLLLVTEQTSMTCLHLFKAMLFFHCEQEDLSKDERRLPLSGSHTCVTTRSCWQSWHDAGCSLDTARQTLCSEKPQGIPAHRPAATLSTKYYHTGRFYKEKAHFQNDNKEIAKLQYSVTNSYSNTLQRDHNSSEFFLHTTCKY